MKLERGLRSTHNLKKTTYKMLRKLHFFEYRGALQNSHKMGNDYCVILYLKHMSEAIGKAYEDYGVTHKMVHDLCNQINDLATSIQKQNRVKRSLLVACLKKHTHVFNLLEYNHIMVNPADNRVCEIWTMKCIPSYVCQFENDI